MCHTIGFGPLALARVLPCLEELVALAATEAEDLGIITAKGSAVAGVDIARTEVTLVDMHFN
jgi:hypothetical protein